MDINIRKLTANDKTPWDLLLLADPSRSQIENYINSGTITIALSENQIIGVYILTKESDDISEIKNIAVDKKFQGKGIGKKLLIDAINRARALGGRTIEVGTGNSSLDQIAFYEKSGFVVTGIDKGYFTRNYKDKIIKNGIVCKDLIKLSLKLNQ